VVPNLTLDDLARRIRARCDGGRGPFVLFLGAGCAKAAGAPSPEVIARQALATFGYDTTPAPKDEPLEHVLSRFTEHTQKLSRSQMSRMLRSLYAKVPVPSFYQDLALTVRERFFPVIVTPNVDALLELALEGVGLRNSDYVVTTLGSPRTDADRPSPRNLRPGGGPLTHIVKLHGELAENIAQLTPGQIDEAIGASRQWIKGEPSSDLIMVGHVPGEPAVDAWLSRTPHRELWWISAEDVTPAVVGAWSDDLHALTGDLGRPQIFFQQIALRLLRAAEASDIPAPAEEGLESVDRESVTRSFGNTARERDSLVDTLQREILRSQSVLSSLAQEGLPGARPAEAQAQIQYEKKRLSSLADRVRLLPEVKPRVLELVDRILDRIRKADPSATPNALVGVIEYVEHEAGALRREFLTETPNRFIVSGSLGATLAVADRLYTEYGEPVVSADDLRALIALVPNAGGRLVP
jgi:hypothetical protein